MGIVQHVVVESRGLESLGSVYDQAELQKLLSTALAFNTLLRHGTVWTINSTAQGGGVAEMLRSLVPYARAVGIDCRWAVLGGEPEFFVLTKRLHNALHGFPGDDSLFSEHGMREFERVSAQNAKELLEQVVPGDVVLLHDPQTLGLAPHLARHGAYVIWRCHVGTNRPNAHSQAAHRFLERYVQYAQMAVFTRPQYVPRGFSRPVRILTPTIDPISPKNQELSSEVVRAILLQSGLLDGPAPEVAPVYRLPNGTLGRVRHGADVTRVGRGCEGRPCILQVSRWDRLKDFLGVLQGFAHFVEHGGKASLILAGPSVHAVADDPEGAEIFDEVLNAFRELPDRIRSCVELANLPMADADENAAIVNALQRHATVIVQKSLQEGFGLTVAEAMWKGKPVIATNVGGIGDQIEHNVSGILLEDPHDYVAFSAALKSVLDNPARAAELGKNARRRVREHFLNLNSLYVLADLITEVLTRARDAKLEVSDTRRPLLA